MAIWGPFGIAVRSLRIETSRERSTNAGEILYYGRMGGEGLKSSDDPPCFVSMCVTVVVATFCGAMFGAMLTGNASRPCFLAMLPG